MVPFRGHVDFWVIMKNTHNGHHEREGTVLKNNMNILTNRVKVLKHRRNNRATWRKRWNRTRPEHAENSEHIIFGKWRSIYKLRRGKCRKSQIYCTIIGTFCKMTEVDEMKANCWKASESQGRCERDVWPKHEGKHVWKTKKSNRWNKCPPGNYHIPPGEKEDHFNSAFKRGYVGFQEGIYK